MNNATYFTVKLFFLLPLVKNKKNAPTVGNKISEDKIGKFIILQLERLIKQKTQEA